MGVIIGTLSLLVTVLIGWNIYNALDIKKEWNELKNNINEYDSKITSQKNELQNEINNVKNELEAFRQYGFAITDFCQVYTKLGPDKNNFTSTYCKLLNAFRCFTKSKESPSWYAPACIANLKESLTKVKELNEEFDEEQEKTIRTYINEIMNISKNELNDFIKEIIKIDEERKKQPTNK